MKKIISVIIAFMIITWGSVQVYGDENSISDETYTGGMGSGTFDGYDFECSDFCEVSSCGIFTSWYYYIDEENNYCVEYKDYPDMSDKKIIVPDRVNGHEISYIYGSCGFRKFDLNPENKYMKCVDNIIFSKDGKRLISCAQYDERTEYVIPEGTEEICYAAFRDCKNVKKIKLPDSVRELSVDSFEHMNLTEFTLSVNVERIPPYCFYLNPELASFNIPRNSKLNEIEAYALADCGKLQELYLPSFEITVEKMAFSSLRGQETPIRLKSYVQTEVHSEENTITWDKIPNASYYEIYQKLNSGEYVLLGKTKAAAHTFGSLKPGAEYTLAVKPIAVIPAENYDKKWDEGKYPESFTIEGTMSEDVVVRN